MHECKEGKQYKVNVTHTEKPSVQTLNWKQHTILLKY